MQNGKRNKWVTISKSALICFLAVGIVMASITDPVRNCMETGVVHAATKQKAFVIKKGVLEQYKGEEENVVIPKEVKSIGAGAFSLNSHIKTVTIPSTVTKIHRYAFGRCRNLKQVIGGKKVTEVGEDAFKNTLWEKETLDKGGIAILGTVVTAIDGRKTSISIPKEAKKISDGAMKCYKRSELEIDDNSKFTKLEKVTLPQGITYIGKRAFEDAIALKAVNIPSSVKCIGAEAFYHCMSLKKMKLTSDKITIGRSAFAECIELSNVSVTGIITKMGAMAFTGTLWMEDANKDKGIVTLGHILVSGKNIEGDYVIPEDIYNLADNAFDSNKSITSVTCNSNMTEIASRAFYKCPNLQKVKLTKKIKEIGERAFYKCKKLESVTGGKNIVTISQYAFEGAGLKKMELPSSLEEIGKYAFRNSQITSIIIPNKISSIADGTFYGAAHLRSIQLPKKLKKIERCAFQGTGLEKVQLPSSLEKIGEYAFWRSQITNITIPGTVKKIEGGAFSNCLKLKKVIMENGIQQLGHGCFFRCKKLKTVEIPKTVTKIDGSNVFQDTLWLKEQLQKSTYIIVGDGILYRANEKKIGSIAKIPSNVKYICNSAFKGYTKLKKVILPDNLRVIHNSAFYNTGLRELKIPQKVKRIERYAFHGTQIKTLVIPKNVTSLQEYSFSDCKELYKVIVKSSIKRIELETFERCDQLSSICLGENIKEVLGWGGHRNKAALFLGDHVTKMSPCIGKYFRVYIKKGTTTAKTAERNKIKWTDSKGYHIISYDCNGGMFSRKPKITFKSNTKTFSLPTPVREGYTFKGWYKDKNLKHKITKVARGTKHSFTVYAKWKKN